MGKKLFLKFMLIFVTIMFIGVMSVNAETPCDNVDGVSCAYCVYDIVRINENIRCSFTFSVLFKNDGSGLEYKAISGPSSNSGYVKFEVNYNNFKKNDFVSSNSIVCPKLKTEETVSTAGQRTALITMKVYPDSANGTLSANSAQSVVKQGSTTSGETTPELKESYVCQYKSSNIGEFTISVNNGKLSVSGGNQACNGIIELDGLDVEAYTNKSCPDVYTLFNTREKTVCKVYKSHPGGGNTVKVSGKLYNQNTGTPTNPGNNQTTPSPAEYTEKVNYNNLCSNEGVSDAFRILGMIVYILKIAAPLLIIVTGMIDYFKAVTSSDEEALSKATESLIRRIISGVIVFLLPTIIWSIINLLDITDGIHDLDDSSFGVCTRCLLKNECSGTSSGGGSGGGSGSAATSGQSATKRETTIDMAQ